ncbi:MAG TPA: hypothetical protein ENN19_05350 [Chloroflexi bacterium]|nr:hypothetical protein [Chloroflexota bacterium]
MKAKKLRTNYLLVGSLLLTILGGLCWFSHRSAQATGPPSLSQASLCQAGEGGPVVPQPLPPEKLAAPNPLTGMSMEQIDAAAQNLAPEAQHVLNSIDVQFHNLYPATTLNGATQETSISIQTNMCVEKIWAQIIMPAQSTGEAKFSYVLKSPSSNVDRLSDWIRFPFVAVAGTATGGVGLDPFAEGVHRFTWVVGYENTVLMSQDGFFAVGACVCDGTSTAAVETPAAPPSPPMPISGLSDSRSMAPNPLDGMSLEQIKEASQALSAAELQALSALNVQFHNLYPEVALGGATVETSVSIQSDVCLDDMWAQVIMPAHLTGQAKFAHAFKSPSSVWDRLSDWIRFPFPAVGGAVAAGVGLDGFEEGIYPFTWVVGQGDTVLMTRDGFLSVGPCNCGGMCTTQTQTPVDAAPLTDATLDELKTAAQNLSPEAQQILSTMDIQFHNLYPAMTLGGPTAATSVTIQTDLCIADMWAQIVMPAHLTGQAKFAHAFKSPSSVWDRLSDWVRFPFPAVSGVASGGVGLDSFQEGVYNFTWVVGYADTVLLTRDGFFAVGPCGCASPCPTMTPTPVATPTPSPTPLAASECVQHSPGQLDVQMGGGQTIYREVEFANTCVSDVILDLQLTDLVSQIYLAGGHERIALTSGERQTVRLYFSTGDSVLPVDTELLAMAGVEETARIPIRLQAGAAIAPSNALNANLANVTLLPGEVGAFAGALRNNAGVPLTITAHVPTTASTWLAVMDAAPTSSSMPRQSPTPATWWLAPGEQGEMHVILGSIETFAAQAPVTLESQYGDRQTIMVGAWFGPYADLAISGGALPPAMAPGDALSITLFIANHGPSDGLTVTIPISITGDAAVANLGRSVGVDCVLDGGVVCHTPNLPSGQSVTVTLGIEAYQSQAQAAGTNPMHALLRARISAHTYDPNALNNTWSSLWGGYRIYLPLATQNWKGRSWSLYLPVVAKGS